MKIVWIPAEVDVSCHRVGHSQIVPPSDPSRATDFPVGDVANSRVSPCP